MTNIRGVQNGNVLYHRGVTLLDTRRAMDSLMYRGRSHAIGLSDITLDGLMPIFEAAKSYRLFHPKGRQAYVRRPLAPKCSIRL